MIRKQKEICQKYSASYTASYPKEKMGIASNVKEGLFPINGLRTQPEDGTCGWYIWAGEEFSRDDDFFSTVHVEHIHEWNKDIEKYLGLPPGWRFLIADNYEDIWYDATILDEK